MISSFRDTLKLTVILKHLWVYLHEQFTFCFHFSLFFPFPVRFTYFLFSLFIYYLLNGMWRIFDIISRIFQHIPYDSGHDAAHFDLGTGGRGYWRKGVLQEGATCSWMLVTQCTQPLVPSSVRMKVPSPPTGLSGTRSAVQATICQWSSPAGFYRQE
jgi:hypothetical protein